MPLSVARGARLPGDAWSRRDWLLAQAVEFLDRTRCSGCGQPTWLAHDKTYKRLWTAKAERCFSCDALASRQEQMKDTLNPGAVHFRTEYLGH